MKEEKFFKTIPLLKRNKRYDVFLDLEYSNTEKHFYMILEHNPYQSVKELRSQGLCYMGFVVDGYLHFKRKIYPVEIFS